MGRGVQEVSVSDLRRLRGATEQGGTLLVVKDRYCRMHARYLGCSWRSSTGCSPAAPPCRGPATVYRPQLYAYVNSYNAHLSAQYHQQEAGKHGLQRCRRGLRRGLQHQLQRREGEQQAALRHVACWQGVYYGACGLKAGGDQRREGEQQAAL